MPLKHRGFGAYISCDGRELEQFQVKVEGDKTVSCYIPGDTGTEYKVHWVDSKPPSHLSVEVRTDGRRIGVVSHTKGSSKTSHPGLRVPLDANCSSKFLHVPDVGDALPSAYSEELGTIEIRLRRVRDFITVPHHPKSTHAGPSRNQGRTGSTNGASTSISRGITKSASTRNGKENKPKPTILRPILIDDKPYVVFRFLYRPSEILEANGVKLSRGKDTRKPTPSPPPSKRRKRVSKGVPSGVAVEEDSQPSPKRRRFNPAPDLGQVDPEPYGPRDDGDDDDMYLDIPPKPDGKEIHEHTADHVERSVPGSGPPDTSRFSPPILHMSTVEAPTDAELEDERLVEMHLSSRNVFAPPSRAASILRGPTPVTVKREPSPEAPAIPADIWTDARHDSEIDVKPKIEESAPDEESVVEVHLNSKNQHLVFGDVPEGRVKAEAVKKEEYFEPAFIPHESDLPAVKYEEEETIVEVHISSRDIARSAVRSMKSEPRG